MVPLSERRHRLYHSEIPAVMEGIKLLLEKLLISRKEREKAEIAFRVAYRLVKKGTGRPKYPEFSWDFLSYFLVYYGPNMVIS